MNKIVKRTLGHFKVLIEHSLRPYEPSPEHILKRMIKPICQDVRMMHMKGTRNDSWEFLKGLAEECKAIFNL
ncbi:MAG: hypothetical protein ACUVXA_20715 [Candidatus Jordarchaeum sp.]|uniref:hypothetical protein n=1 Tax=Candidatus Jordarchaeum sp. TaxID=2823881 RepID=UPI00404A9796